LPIYQIMFKGEGRNIFFLLLIGIVFGTLFSSLSSFMQMLIDPNEFQVVQDKMFASFNNINTDLLWLAFII
ncbi:iron chelate uptake ABC transporter family permease subunit, partial [Escherichia coli]|nr:iron chelate uptake ABC transporter family permease subunit [Escherichia coli]